MPLPPLTRKSSGLPVGAVQGFCNMLWKLLLDMKSSPDAPTHLAVVFDHSEKTFRNALYADYKAHRPPAPECTWVPQFALVRGGDLALSGSHAWNCRVSRRTTSSPPIAAMPVTSAARW